MVLRKIRNGLLIGLLVFVITTTALLLGVFGLWQNRFSDSLYAPRQPNRDIAIIAIDDASIQTIGRWPWDRSTFANLLRTLNTPQSRPGAIGIDVAFLEPSNPGSDEKLANEIERLKNVTLAAEADSFVIKNNAVTSPKVLLPVAPLRSQTNYGIVNTYPDGDGVTRRTPVYVNDISVFGLNVLKTYLAGQNKSVPQPPTEPLILINYAGRPGTFPVYSFSDVLTGEVKPETFKDKIVLIGATASDLHDDQITPVSAGIPMDGVEIHANIIDTIAGDRYLNRESAFATIITLAAITFVLGLVLAFVAIVPTIIICAVAFAGYIAYAIFSFDNGTILNLVFPPLAIILSLVGNIIYKYLSEYRQKRYVRKALSYYLSESVMAEILADPRKLKLGGERREITVLFSDIAGFTSISEKLPAEELAGLLNEYLSRMTRIVFENNGVLDKYIGDAVMAFWGAPIKTANHAFLACKTALAMQREIEEIRMDWGKFGIGDFGVRIGVNTGEMVVGNMGSDVRFDYTLIGDNVNLGSRLEGINKEYGTSIIISEATYEQVKEKVVVRKLDTVAVKGKQEGITIYELRFMNDKRITVKEKNLLEKFEEARREYESGNFSKASGKFVQLSKEYPWDKPTQVYIERCAVLSKEKPKNWDGIFRAKSK